MSRHSSAPKARRRAGFEHEFVIGSVAARDVAGDDQIDLFGTVTRAAEAVVHRLPGEVDGVLAASDHPPVLDAGQAFQRDAHLDRATG